MDKNRNDEDPVKHAEELARKYQGKGKPKSRTASNVIQLPLWGAEKRGIPNEIARSALFNVRNKRQPRAYLESAPIVMLGEGRITYRGQELRQDDQDIWLQILHLVRLQPLGEWVEFTPYAMLKTLGWGLSKRDYTRLRDCLSRMQATALAVYSKRLQQGISVSLIRKFEYENGNGLRLDHWRVWIEPEMKILFGDVYYTQLEWDQRQRLGALAKWLHGLYASHATPYPMKVATIRDGCGSETRELYKFRQTLKTALDELVAIKFLVKWHIDDSDSVQVTREKSTLLLK